MLSVSIQEAFCGNVIDTDFNNQSFGILYHGSKWTIQPNGGINNTPAARLEYSSWGAGDNYLTLFFDGVESNEYYVEFNVKIENAPSGGCKFVKFFGSYDTPSQNNMTFGLDNWSNVQKETAFYQDNECTAAWAGVVAGSCSANYVVQSSEIDMRGGTWGHYKLWVKRASPGGTDGAVMVWWNGILRAHITGMNSNPLGSSTPYFNRVEFGGYMHSTFNGNPWYLWVDNLKVSTNDTSPAKHLRLSTGCLRRIDGSCWAW